MLKEQCNKISEKLKSKFPNYDFHFGCVFYRDPIDCESDKNEILPLTKDINQLKVDISKIKASSGEDPVEDWIGAYKLALGETKCPNGIIQWRDGYKIIIHISDYGAHGKNYSESKDDNHQNSKEELSRLMRKCVDKKIKIFAFKIGNMAEKSFKKCKRDYEIYDKTKKGLFSIKEFKQIGEETISETFKRMVEEATLAAINN